ncbi:hypothetical protein KY285_024229 [Solanum tuberosum]|nr:hypothetical protein KY289_024564 [Solanum tuberosum]KAH0673215.1 hypothetical protein KY284_024302 [Solanum tuberosum]KAH0676428.1 hypothetical protein KY285_024229 [Solanum tuberosum]
MSMNTITEEVSDSFDSNTDAIIYGVYDDSGSGESLISDPKIPSSSSSSSEEDDDFLQQQQMISTGFFAVPSIWDADLNGFFAVPPLSPLPSFDGEKCWEKL